MTDETNDTQAVVTREIRQAKLEADSTCSFEFTETNVSEEDPYKFKINHEDNRKIHADLKDAFKALNIHVMIIGEQITISALVEEAIERYFEDPIEFEPIGQEQEHFIDVLEKFHVSEFKIKSSGENEAVCLVGTRLLTSWDMLKITCPDKRWSGDYKYINELRIAVDNCKAEVMAYLNGKKAPSAQIELDLDNQNVEEDETHVSITVDGKTTEMGTTKQFNKNLKAVTKKLKETKPKAKKKVT